MRGNRTAYKADYHRETIGDVVPEPKWRPSIHMPKEAARIWLKVTDVRVERLQEINDKEAKKEGGPLEKEITYIGEGFQTNDFAELWDYTIKKSDFDRYGWDANPWVWVIDFERCEKPNNYYLGEKQNAICD